MNAAAKLDASYFASDTWKQRLAGWLHHHESDALLQGNSGLVRAAAFDDDAPFVETPLYGAEAKAEGPAPAAPRRRR